MWLGLFLCLVVAASASFATEISRREALAQGSSTFLLSGGGNQQQQQQQQPLPFNSAEFDFAPNKDESLVPDYELPQLLVFEDGITPVRDKVDWKRHRNELLNLFRTHQYGTCPEPNYSVTKKCQMEATVLSNDPKALDGLATRRQVRLRLTSTGRTTTTAAKDNCNKSIEWIVLIYIPNNAIGGSGGSSSTVPCFLGLNFAGNQAIHPDPGIIETPLVPGEEQFSIARGGRARKWQVEKVVQRGYALATVYSGQVEPDNPETAFRNGVHKLFADQDFIDSSPASWGTIAAWSWGLSRTLDLFDKTALVPEVDATKVCVMGHSRKGKAALWAAAEDERFAMAISNNSGCCGAALSRRRFGETIQMMNARFPTWTCSRAKRYNDREDALPIDQHQLLALLAPRPVYVASAVDDWWADPKGEFLSAKHAEPVYDLLGLAGMDHLPPAAQSVEVKNKDSLFGQPGLIQDVPFHGPRATIGYHCRSGGHDVLGYDWARYLDFADRHFQK